MSELSIPPDLRDLEIPIDSWTQPFWDGTAARTLLLPRCSQCHRFRWPPGPFCPHCQSQRVEWCSPGIARLYSFTIIREQRPEAAELARARVPALIEFPDADGVRLVAAIVNTRLDSIRIGAEVALGWSHAANGNVPVFTIPE